MKKSSLDLLKIGMFLLGISALILSGIALHAYLRSLNEEPYSSPFYAYCQQGNIIIQANQDLDNISVYDTKQNMFCHFNQIPRTSEELCDVNDVNSTMFVVESPLSKKVVSCYLSEKPLLR